MLLVAVAGAQALADAVGDFEEFRRLADVERAFLRERTVDDIGDTAGRGLITTILVER